MKQTENEMNVNVPLEVIKASEIEPKEVKWLWYPYIPFGKVTLLQGDPGDGKSKLKLLISLNQKVTQSDAPFHDGGTWTTRLPAERRNLTRTVNYVKRGKPVFSPAKSRKADRKESPWKMRVRNDGKSERRPCNGDG